MTRAALLPAGSDPFLLAYWLRNFATWADKVDELHIAVISGSLDKEAKRYVDDVASAVGAFVHHVKERTHHGTMLERLVKWTKADHVMLCEDDAYIRDPAIVEECFRWAESGGIAATPRGGYASDEILVAAEAKFGDPHSYWPCFVFVARKTLVGAQLGGTIWPEGDVVLDHTLRERAVGDTFVSASYELRALDLPEQLHDNFRLSGQTVPDDAPWFHVGSLSSGHGYMFMGDLSPEQYRDEVIGFHRLPPGNAAQRLAWWGRAWRSCDGAIPDYHHRYGDALEKLRSDCEVPENEVEFHQQVGDRLVTWAER
jgi:hypothetical protein